MLYAVIFRNRAEELVIRAIEDSSIEEALRLLSPNGIKIMKAQKRNVSILYLERAPFQ